MSLNRQLSKATKTIFSGTGTAAGQTKITGTYFDTFGYEAYRIVAMIGTVTTNGQVVLGVQESTTSGSGYAACTWGPNSQGNTVGSSVVSAANTTSNSIMILEVYKPQMRYVQWTLDRSGGSANVAITAVLVELYIADRQPVTQDSTVASYTFVDNPA